MLRNTSRARILVCAVILAAACRAATDASSPSQTGAAALNVVSGNGQSGLIGSALPAPLVVAVTAASGAPVPGVAVTFRVAAGVATVAPTTATTDANGRAQATITFGSTPGTVEVTGTIAGTALMVVFLEAAGTGVTTLACQSASPALLALGEVRPALSGSGVCLSGGTSGADYALVAFHASTTPSATAAVDVTGHGVTPLNSPALLPGGGGLALARDIAGDDRAVVFERQLRLMERRTLPLLFSAARAGRARRALRDVIPASVTVGQILRLNANGSDACTTFDYRFGRVVSVTSKAIVVADTANPVGGFTDAEYQSIAVTFDTLINPLDTQAFGEPSDIDHNGRILIFFTRAVNALTPRGSSGFVGGFFFARDLFPLANSPEFEGCPTSNVGEMFYMLVADPNGLVNGNVRSKANVLTLTIGTLAHEYQHLINAARRIYVNNAPDLEEVWLNEGLSHTAEELLFYRVSGLAPRQNVDATTITATQARVDAFNNYQSGNTGRYHAFLNKATQTSPYAANDSLETRGATWSMLRWLADHRGSSDGDTWSLLVNSTTTGTANLQSVFGAGVLTQIRDWATAVIADDLVATDARYQQPSWNYRSIFPRVGVPTFPLQVTPLANDVPSGLTLSGGGMAFTRFTVAAGNQASVDWAASGGGLVSPLVQWTLVRTR